MPQNCLEFRARDEVAEVKENRVPISTRQLSNPQLLLAHPDLKQANHDRPNAAPRCRNQGGGEGGTAEENWAWSTTKLLWGL